MKIEQLPESLIKMWNTQQKGEENICTGSESACWLGRQLVSGRVFTRRQQEDERPAGKQLADLSLATAPASWWPSSIQPGNRPRAIDSSFLARVFSRRS